MMDDNRLSVKISIADRIYPLKIARQNEEKLRKAAALINQDIAQYKGHSDRDTQDVLAISALQFVIRLLDSEANKDLSPLEEGLMELDKELNNYLNNIE